MRLWSNQRTKIPRFDFDTRKFLVADKTTTRKVMYFCISFSDLKTILIACGASAAAVIVLLMLAVFGVWR